jgi:hypothetical protein
MKIEDITAATRLVIMAHQLAVVDPAPGVHVRVWRVIASVATAFVRVRGAPWPLAL